jgi:transposase
MGKTKISDAEIVVYALQDEILRSNETRYNHRPHAVLLVSQRLSWRKIAQLLGDSPKAVVYWAKRFEDEGLSGLAEAERHGRLRWLQPEQFNKIAVALSDTPLDFGFSANLWNGKMLSAFIKKQFEIGLEVRQFGFRLRKPLLTIAHADPNEQLTFKNHSSFQKLKL